MPEKIDKVETRLKELDALIAETQKRLPAHSVKPAVMMELLDLEDEYESLLRELKQLKNASF